LAYERRCVDLQRVQDVVHEIDRSLAETGARRGGRIAQPAPWPVHGDGVNALQVPQKMGEGRREGVGAMEEDRWLTVPGLHYVHTTPVSCFDVPATNGQGVQHRALGSQDCLRVATDVRLASV
jgi:hypothetical protein